MQQPCSSWFQRSAVVAVLLALAAFAAMAASAEAVQPNLKILSWNLKLLPTTFEAFSEKLQCDQRLRTPWIVEFLNAQDYDILVLQEVLDPAATTSLKEGLKAQYPYIIAAEPKRGIVGAAGGNLIASRVPLQYVAHITFKYVAGVDAVAEKGCLLVQGEKEGVRFQVAGTHLQAGHQDMKDKEYFEVGDGIIRPHKQDGVPQFLIGDMNTKEGTDKFEMLLNATEMRAFPIDDPRPYTSDGENSFHPSNKTPGKVDHVLLNPRGTQTTILRQTIQRARREHEGKIMDLSDHYGLVAEIFLGP